MGFLTAFDRKAGRLQVSDTELGDNLLIQAHQSMLLELGMMNMGWPLVDWSLMLHDTLACTLPWNWCCLGPSRTHLTFRSHQICVQCSKESFDKDWVPPPSFPLLLLPGCWHLNSSQLIQLNSTQSTQS